MFAPAFAAISGIRRYRGIVSQISFQTPCPKTSGSPNFHVDGQTNEQPLGQRDAGGGGYSERGSNFKIEYGRDRHGFISLT
jgi:hypothetical protein